MSLVFAAITPHPPILIPTIGKEHIKSVKKTIDALIKLEEDLYAAKPQVIFLISPHGSLFPDAFSVNAHTSFESSFQTFGDLVTKKQWQGSPELAATISSQAKLHSLPIQLVSQEQIDHGTSVPLTYLADHLPDVKIVPIGYSGLDRETHVRYGELLKDIAIATDKRVAIIASGDLSHCLNSDAPVPFNADGKIFDENIIEFLELRNTTGIIQLDENLVNNAAECGYRSLLILLGVLKNMHFTFKNYSYEAPFGVGYLVGNFVL